MSIAVSTVVRPSRILAFLTMAMCALVLCIGGAIAAGLIGELGLQARLPLGALCIFLPALVCYRTVQNRKAHHIDITGHGRIRLVEHSALVGKIMTAELRIHRGRAGDAPGDIVSLMPDSTLWPAFLLLRLETDEGRIVVLPILPDSVEGGGFRALAVACRWIAAHNNPKDHTQV
jgi:toxin CptA